jgi:hypothetical protein
MAYFEVGNGRWDGRTNFGTSAIKLLWGTVSDARTADHRNAQLRKVKYQIADQQKQASRFPRVRRSAATKLDICSSSRLFN